MRILIADDSPVIRTAVTELLVTNGYEVVQANDGIEAVQRFYEELPDLVLLDLQMPGLNGYVACRMIKEDWSVAHIPVIILTAHQSAEDRYWAHKSGADAYLTKDHLGNDLLSAIRSARASRALAELNREADATRLDQVDVLTRVCEMLDRKLFEASIMNDIVSLSTRALDLRATVSHTMQIVRRFVDFDIGGIALREDKSLGVRTTRPVSRNDVEQFRSVVVGNMEQLTSTSIDPSEINVWLDDDATIEPGSDMGGMPSLFAMPLRSRGEVVGVLAVASTKPGVYAPALVRTLRLVEYPISTVIDSAYHHQKLLEQEARLSLSSLGER